MWKTQLKPETKPFCLCITLWITKEVIHIIHRSEYCRKLNLDLKITCQQDINSLSTGLSTIIVIYDFLIVL